MNSYQEQILNFLNNKKNVYQEKTQSSKMFIYLNWLWVFIIALIFVLNKMWWVSLVCIILYLPIFIWLLTIKSFLKSIFWGLAFCATSVALFLGVVYPFFFYYGFVYIVCIELIISIINIFIFEYKLHSNMKKSAYAVIPIMKGTSKYSVWVSAVVTVLASWIMRRVAFSVSTSILYNVLLILAVWFSSFLVLLAYMQFKYLFYCYKYSFE